MDRLTIEFDGSYTPVGMCSTSRNGEVDDLDGCKDYCEMVKGACESGGCVIQECFNKLGEYEDLEEQGKLLKLPCAVGNTVHVLQIDNLTYMITKEKIWEIVEGKFEIRHFDSIGKTVFLTREEAEDALYEMQHPDWKDNFMDRFTQIN